MRACRKSWLFARSMQTTVSSSGIGFEFQNFATYGLRTTFKTSRLSLRKIRLHLHMRSVLPICLLLVRLRSQPLTTEVGIDVHAREPEAWTEGNPICSSTGRQWLWCYHGHETLAVAIWTHRLSQIHPSFTVEVKNDTRLDENSSFTRGCGGVG